MEMGRGVFVLSFKVLAGEVLDERQRPLFEVAIADTMHVRNESATWILRIRFYRRALYSETLPTPFLPSSLV